MRNGPERAAALDRQAAAEPSLARAQAIAREADRLRALPDPGLPHARMALYLFRN